MKKKKKSEISAGYSTKFKNKKGIHFKKCGTSLGIYTFFFKSLNKLGGYKFLLHVTGGL